MSKLNENSQADNKVLCLGFMFVDSNCKAEFRKFCLPQGLVTTDLLQWSAWSSCPPLSGYACQHHPRRVLTLDNTIS